MTPEFFRQIFEKCSNIKFHKSPASGRPAVPCGQTYMTKLTVAFRNFAKAPKNGSPSPPEDRPNASDTLGTVTGIFSVTRVFSLSQYIQFGD